MINYLTIDHFRIFSKLRMENIGRVNLIVGRNNSGKSSILEALSLLAAPGDQSALWNLCVRRGEQFAAEAIPGRPIYQEVAVSHLFNGHILKLGAHFSISSANGGPDAIKYTVVEANVNENPALFANIQNEFGGQSGSLALRCEGTRVGPPHLIPLTRRGGLRQDSLQVVLNMTHAQRLLTQAVQFITTGSLSFGELVNLWNGIVLTPEEDRVVEALKTLDPAITRIAATGANLQFFPAAPKGGFAVRREGEDQPLPIGNFGDGTWRMLAIAIGISRAANGILLVDEIDTGLHHSAMKSLWEIVAKAARELNVQVFATTHSFDCVHSLAAICTAEAIEENAITIHRVDPEREVSIAYSAKQVKIIAEQDIEVR